ncbi:L,D-transpeptidase family protein [Dyella ginsengisoli]|uniref:L,D-transpeptidase family protein n=1 Tax=Dyella ginsengisoli TaxID=363848 RepID=UPI000366F87A|nr:L,D-transpeptidase family protein [Dyella ginsengisoli]
MSSPRRTRLPIALLLALLLWPAASLRAATRYFWHPEIAPAGPVVVIVSLDEQSIYVYRNGVAIGAGPISSGKPGYETPPGVYSILQKEREHRSNLYDDAPMPYMQRLTWDGVALHGGVLPGHPASHGCVRLPPAFAEKLFAVTQRGGIVVVSDSKVSPAPIVHPAAVAPIDLTGAPMAVPDGGDDTLTLAPGGALGVVVSTYDQRVYVLRNGVLMGQAPLAMAPGEIPAGTLLYVMTGRAEAGGDNRPTLPRWSAYRILGEGPVPDPATMAAQIHVPGGFGQRLRDAMVPGTTVLVTDLPGLGGDEKAPYAKLLESTSPEPTTAKPVTPRESR